MTMHDVISDERRVRGPGLQVLVGRVPSRGVTFDVGYISAERSPALFPCRQLHRARSFAAIGCALVLFGLTACHSTAPITSLQRFEFAELHMATVFRIVLYAPDETTANHAAETAFRRIAKLDDLLTDYDQNSELMRLCRQPVGRPVPVSRELFAVLQKSQKLAARTDGAFDMTVGPLVQLWRASRKSHVLPDAGQIAEAKRACGYRNIALNARNRTVVLKVPHMRLDAGGIAKGYAADEALQLLRQMGIPRALVAASGDIATGDAPPGRPGWNVGIESIDAPLTGLSRSVILRHAGISTSGDTEQYVEIDGRRYSHIVNPATGLGLTERIGVTIIAPNSTDSDRLATAVSVLGAAKGLAFIESQSACAALIVTLTNGGTQVLESRRFPRLTGAPAARDSQPKAPESSSARTLPVR